MTLASRLSLCLLCLLLSVACGDDEVECVGGADAPTIDEYVAANGLTTTEGEGGLQYIIFEPGTANRPSANSQVTVTYKGYTTTEPGDTFDQNTRVPFQLSNLIEGWRQGIPLIGTGGRMQLFVPSSLGYGSQRAGNICPDSDLIFDITLEGFQ